MERDTLVGAAPPPSLPRTVIILRSLVASVEELLDAAEVLPPVEALRPASCPGCGELAFGAGRPLGIVGHGTYTRQVLGVASAVRDVLVRVRRFLCRGCGKTMSVLADVLYPGCWYAGTVILEALRLHLVAGLSEREVRSRFAVVVGSESWRSLRRWRRELFWPLWGWLAATLGARGPARTRDEGRRRVLRLVADALATVGGAREDGAGARAARRLLAGTVHGRGRCWPLGQAPPDSVAWRPRRE